MKTSGTIGRQESNKETERKGVHRAQSRVPMSAEAKAAVKAAHIAKIAPFRFKPGQSGNPGGKPKVDLAAQIARAIFENDAPAILAAYSKMLRKGSPYAFQVLSDRAYGKLKEQHQVEVGPYRDLSEDELKARIKTLEQELRILPAKFASDDVPKPESGDPKPN